MTKASGCSQLLQKTLDTITAKLIVANASAWKVSFDVRFGTLRPSGALVRLYKGDTIIGWVGADVWYKNLGIVSADQNFKLTVPADTQWHHIEYASDGRTLSIFHNGQKIGEDTLRGAPDRIFVGSTSPSQDTPAQQTEVWLRDVHEDITYVANTQVASTPRPQAVSPFSQEGTDQQQYKRTSELPLSSTGETRDILTESLPQTYNKLASSIQSSIILTLFAGGNTLPLFSYSHVDVDLAQKNPVLEYREETVLGTTLDQVDLSQVDTANTKIASLPSTTTTNSYTPAHYLVMIESKKSSNSFFDYRTLLV